MLRSSHGMCCSDQLNPPRQADILPSTDVRSKDIDPNRACYPLRPRRCNNGWKAHVCGFCCLAGAAETAMASWTGNARACYISWKQVRAATGERFLVVFGPLRLSPKRCVQSRDGKLVRLGSRALIRDRAWKMEKSCLAWKICLSAFGMGIIGSNEAVTSPLLLTCCLLPSYVRPSRIPR